jgi:hypothetical protein
MPDSSGTERSGVIVRGQPQGRRAALHPLGQLVARQQLVPLEITIHRYKGHNVPPQLWSITAASLTEARLTDHPEPIRDEFARTHYFDLSEAEQLSLKGFTEEIAGAVVASVDQQLGKAIESPDDDFDEQLIVPHDRVVPRKRYRSTKRGPQAIAALELVAASRDLHLETVWWSDGADRAVVVDKIQPLAAATVDALRLVALDVPLENRSELQAAQMLAGTRIAGIQLVERWEARR